MQGNRPQERVEDVPMPTGSLTSGLPASPQRERPTELRDFLPEPLPVTDFTPEDQYFSFDTLPPFPRPWRHPLKCVAWIAALLFGLASLVLLLAVLAAIPIVNFVALGYLLEAEGRIARTGKLRYALPLLPLAPRLGSIAFGVWFWLLIVRVVADAASDARTIAPGSAIAGVWQVGLWVLSASVAAHLVLALARGGGFWCFFRPIKNLRWLLGALAEGDYFLRAQAAVKEFVVALRLPHHFWLGLRGFAGMFAWLIVPTILFGALQDTNRPGQVLVTLFGGALLILVLGWAPLLQAHFAAENRLSAYREVGKIRELYRRTPVTWFLVLVLMYALALPLYLFKIAAPPRDALWFVTLIFIVTIYPARMLVAWAYARAVRRERRQWLLVRCACRVLLVPLLAFYLFILFFTPAISAAGRRVLFEQHALLLPTPF